AQPSFVPSQTVRLKPTLPAGQNEVVLYLVAREISPGKDGTQVIWHRPRFEGNKQVPFLLRDVAAFPRPFEIDTRAALGDTAKQLAAAAEAAKDKSQSVDALAKKHGVELAMLKRWVEFLASEPVEGVEVKVPALQLLPRKLPDNADKPAIKGWGDTTP